MTDFTFTLIAACSFPSRGLGKDGTMLWTVREDLRWFNHITTAIQGIGNVPVVVMGRKTWESLPEKRRPLPERLNIVLTKSPEKHVNQSRNVIFCKFENLLEILKGNGFPIDKNINVIGGGEIYKLFLESKLPITTIYITEIYLPKEPEFDAYFPEITNHTLSAVTPFSKSKDQDIYFRMMTYSSNPFNKWVNKEEDTYLRLMEEIVSTGSSRDDRTGVGTFSLFGKHLTYDLSDTFPLSTTKKMFMRGIFEELMMYLRGKTDNNILISKGVHVWDGNTSRDFLDKRGLSQYKEGDMGSTYGFNFRHFGAEYKGCDADYSNQGFDQLREVIHLIKTDPSSRRMIINLWDPRANTGAALPACLCMYQFFVRSGTYLDLQIYIRSSDYFLANNWNTCTGALLVHLICSLSGVNLTPGTLSVCMGDTHIYKSHIQQVMENVRRTPYPFPKLVVKEKKANIEDFEFSDIQLIGYKSHNRIAAPMAV